MVYGLCAIEPVYVCHKKRLSNARRVDIDTSKLSSIRRSADSTRDKLLVDDAEDTAAEELALPDSTEDTPSESSPVDGSGNSCELLSEPETAFLRALLSGGDWKAAARNAGSLPSLLADSINEKLFDNFGDTVIDCSSDVPELIPDYSDELNDLIR